MTIIVTSYLCKKREDLSSSIDSQKTNKNMLNKGRSKTLRN